MSVKPEMEKADNIPASGYISIDERRTIKFSARISGRIEKLYVKYNVQFVNKGDKIMELYSPELSAYQSELRYLVSSNADPRTIGRSEEKLRLLGLSHDQIMELKFSEEPFYTITVRSMQSGYIFFSPPDTPQQTLEVKSPEEANMNDAPTGGRQSTFAVSNIQLREGSYVNQGDALFWMNDLRVVWALLAIPNNRQQDIKAMANVSILSELFPHDTIRTKVDFIEPMYRPAQKFIRVRVDLPNLNYRYKINSLVNAQIESTSTPVLSVPYGSVLFLGKRKVVWVFQRYTGQGNRIYEARDVVTGIAFRDRIEIKSGLARDEEVAMNAAYLLDRESLIKPGNP